MTHAQDVAQVQNKAPETKEKPKEMKEFAENNYLQIGATDIPDVLRRIEDQFKENIIDVIIHSKTHMPIFAQKREEGYSQNYKKFFGLDIKVLPIKDEEDFYLLNLFYYNWTTNKFDKNLKRRISKYNVLNEVRIATYEILMGKQWTIDNKENIEARNFKRIQAVREVLEQNKRLKKKKEKEVKKKKMMQEKAEELIKERRLLKREEKPKKERKDNSEIDDKNNEDTIKAVDEEFDSSSSEDLTEDQVQKTFNSKRDNPNNPKKNPKNNKSNESADDIINEAEPSLPNIELEVDKVPKKIFLYGFTNYFQESTRVQGLVPTTTDLKYFGIGGTFKLERQTSPYPTGMQFEVLVAAPVFKEEYSFPIYRSIKSELYFSNVLKYFSFFGGLDFTPNYFISLPGEGLRFQVYENDFLWAKIGGSVETEINQKKIKFKMSYLKSLLMKSNQDEKFVANKLQMDAYYQIFKQHGVEVNYSSTYALGSFELASKKVGLSYVYRFEN